MYIKKFYLIDWGLGIGDWAQSPIPNPQSPIPNPHDKIFKINLYNYFKEFSFILFQICFYVKNN